MCFNYVVVFFVKVLGGLGVKLKLFNKGKIISNMNDVLNGSCEF